MAPVRQEIEAERAANLAKAQQQMGFAKAAAALLQGVAPRVQQTYTNAANADAGYAGGLSSDVQQAVNQQAGGDNAFLQKMGTPAAGLVHPADVGGTAYGLQGYIPATTLQREGAAFGSAAQMLPGDVLRQGQQQVGATLANDPNVAALQGQLAKIAATQPEVYNKLLQSLQSNQFRRVELGQGQERINLEGQTAHFNEQAKAQSLNLESKRAAQLALNANRSYRLALGNLGIRKKDLQLRAIGLEQKHKGGGFTPDELVHLRGEAGGVARDAFTGIPGTTTKKALPPLNYKKAMQAEILHGIPPSIAAKALKQAGYKAGIRGTPYPRDSALQAILKPVNIPGLAPPPGP